MSYGLGEDAVSGSVTGGFDDTFRWLTGQIVRVMADFTKYRVWQCAHALVLDLYRSTSSFPREEQYDLVRQIRRSASSIPTNLAEGIGKRGDKEKARFANIAIGSAYELEYQLLLARDLGYLNTPDHSTLISALFAVRKMLHAFHRRLRAD